MIKTNKFHIHAVNNSTFKVVTTGSKLANRLNRATKQYPGYQIQDGEEPVFSFSARQIGKFTSELRGDIDRVGLREMIEREMIRYNTEGVEDND